MCSRWGTDLGPVDKGLYTSLRGLIGPELSFLCDFIGTAARLLATVVSAVPVCILISNVFSETRTLEVLGY
jgi:retrograde regulation protein 2